MSGGDKKLTTSQKIFTRWLRAESISDNIVGLIGDLERLTRTTKGAEKKGLRMALSLMADSHMILIKAQNALDEVMEMEKPAKKAKPRYHGPM